MKLGDIFSELKVFSFEFKISSKDAQLAEPPLYNKILASLQKEFGFQYIIR